ncbi:MAG: PrsW family intramembrane metalloprotease, partial [Actinomycetia bacterium]|nr:PrsW family intramembrane metalloprotease [Actinomycetes bacterium]
MSVVSEAAAERRFRRLAGLPREVDPRLSWWRRKTVGPQLWVVLAATVVFAIGLTWQYREVSRSVMAEIKAYTEQIGNPTELTISQFNEALHGAMFNFSAQLHPFQLHPGALWTVTFYVLVFLLLDRWRPTTPSMKYVALGWGAACATLIALYVNTWASDLSNVIGPVDPTSSARAAIFIAPFVEEACKATVVFLLAVAVRYRLVSSLQMVALAGLSGVGFAFTENLIYYVRQYVYAVKIFGNDPVADLNQLMWLRGVATSFGHPLFTSMTAVGVIVALHSASRVVR